MKLIIAGSRDVLSAPIGKVIKQQKLEVTEIVSGGARGADRLGEQWAKEEHIPVKLFKADWDKYGKGAGFIRNKQMAEYGDALLALWDGKSRGTENMIKLMQEKGKPVYFYYTTGRG